MEVLEFWGDCRNYGDGNGASGKLIIYDDRIVFHPASAMKVLTLGKPLEDFTMYLKDIIKCEKKLLGFMKIYDNNGNIMILNVFKKSDIIAAIEERQSRLR